MVKLLLIIIAVVLAVIFAIDNMHRVTIGFIAGPPIEIRMFFVIMTAFLGGILTTLLLSMYWRALSSKRKEEKPKEEDAHFS